MRGSAQLFVLIGTAIQDAVFGDEEDDRLVSNEIHVHVFGSTWSVIILYSSIYFVIMVCKLIWYYKYHMYRLLDFPKHSQHKYVLIDIRRS